MSFYETIHLDPGEIFPTITAHVDLNAAIIFAESHPVTQINEYGGNYGVYEKCAFCGEWVPVSELDKDNYCTYCLSYLKARGEI